MAQQELSGEELRKILNAVARGDDEALKRLYRHYHGFVYAFVRQRLSNPSDVEEVVQDVFLAVARKPMAYQWDSRYTTYLCSIAKNKAVDVLRSRGDGPYADLDDAMCAAIPDPEAHHQVMDAISSRQAMDRLRGCMDRLDSEEQREAFFWTFFEDEDLATVAARMACPVGTVKSRLYLARQALMRCLTGWYREVKHG